ASDRIACASPQVTRWLARREGKSYKAPVLSCTRPTPSPRPDIGFRIRTRTRERNKIVAPKKAQRPLWRSIHGPWAAARLSERAGRARRHAAEPVAPRRD